jgi:UDP-glucose 4-epimerase
MCSTGGAGYIGSHTVIQLVQAGFRVTVLDNFCNSCPAVIERLNVILGVNVPFVNIDLRDRKAVLSFLKKNSFDGVIHYAALKAVGESVATPLAYYENNIGGLVNLLGAMKDVGLKRIVFSSSATVYSASEKPLTESSPLGATNPYGQTKLMAEQVLHDLFVSDKEWQISVLRYFNPVGAHASGRIGESPSQPNNLLPYIQQVAVGRRPHLNVFGSDWNTRDGTGTIYR